MTSRPRRIQVHLTEAQRRAAIRLGRARGRTLASVVRDALDRYLEAEDDDGVSWDGDSALALVGTLLLPSLRRVALSDAIDRTVYD